MHHARSTWVAAGTAVAATALLLAYLPQLTASAAVQTLTMPPVADASADASSPATAFGTATALEVDGRPTKEAFLRFDVSGVGAGTVLGTRLRLYSTGGTPDGGTVRRVSDTTWNEVTLTWSNRPTIDGEVVGSAEHVSANSWHEVDLGVLVTADGPVSIALQSSHSNGTAYGSRESGFVPELIVLVDDGIIDPSPTGEPSPSESPSPSPSPSPTESPSPSPSPSPPPTTVNVTPVADGTADSAQPAAALGAAHHLEVDDQPTKHAFLRFDVTGIGSETVTGARLRLWVTDAGPQGGTISLITDTSWSESTLTWNNRPAIDGPSLGTIGSVSADTWVELDVGTAVSTDGAVSFAIVTDHRNGVAFASRESLNAPQLIIELDLEPSPSPSPSESPSPSASPSPSESPSPSVSPSPSPTPPPSETLVFTPTADVYVRSTTPITNYGSDPTVEVDADPFQESFLRFDISGIGADQVVTDVRLSLYTVDPSSQGGRVFGITDTSWDENAVTWEARPAIDGEILTAFWGVTRNVWETRSLGVAITGNGSFNIAMDSNNNDGADYGSRESVTPPTLEIDLAPAEPEPSPEPRLYPVVAAAGDIACDPIHPSYNDGAGTPTDCRQMATSDLILDGNYDAVISLGDLQYEEGTLEQFTASYDPSWGRFKSITVPAIGNHEYRTPGAAGYFDYWGTRAGDASTAYYSLDIGDWHVIVLNSNCGVVSCAAGSAQETWLREDLAANPAQCTMAVMHHPRWASSAKTEGTNLIPLWEALHDFGAELVLAGHSHNYERFAPMDAQGNLSATGIRHFIAGTGGRDFEDPGSEMHANSEAFTLTAFGVLELTLRLDAYDWVYRSIPGQTYTDSGSTACH